MSKIILKSSVLYRFSTLYKLEKKDGHLIRFEIFNNKLYGIASNGDVAVVEYLGESPETNSCCFIIPSASVMNFAQQCRYSDSDVVIETIPEIASGTLMCDSFMETRCFYWGESTFLENWKDWFVDPPNESQGFMFWNMFQIQCLFEASPTGELVFPKVFDCSKPVPIRDINNSNWVGFFIPTPKDKMVLKPVEKPDWWAK